MTTAWLIAGIVVVSMLFGAVVTYAIFQALRNARLEGRIQSIGAQLRNVPKRRTDRQET